MKQRGPQQEPEPEPDFDQAMARLSAIADEMEQGGLPLSRLQLLFEEGIRLARLCERKLNEVERRIELLLEQENGEIERAPFDEETPAGEEDD